MGRSFRIARIAGIDLNIHPTFLLMLPLGALMWGGGGGMPGALFGMLMMVLLFICVLLHELGHALTARALGIPVREIQLLPIGGVAVLGRPVLNPGHELLITIMGPVVNVLIIVALAAFAVATGLVARVSPETVVGLGGTPGLDGVVLWLIQANALLAIFNLIPAFPLDGGRVARALMAFVMDYRRATVIAATVGQVIAVLLGILGLYSLNFLLVITAVFIFLSARQEVAASEVVGALDMIRAGDALAAQPAVVQVGQRIRDAAEVLLATRQNAAVVLQGERPIGVVARNDVQAAIAAGRGEMWVTMVMRRQLVSVQVSDSLDAARLMMAEQHTPVVMVFDGETFRGLLTIDDIAAAFARRGRGGPPPQVPRAPEVTPAP